MPTHYRRMYLQLLEDALTKESKAVEESMNKNNTPGKTRF